MYIKFLPIAVILAMPFELIAGGTRIWEMAGFVELEKGVLEGTTLSSRGEVSLGLHSTKIDLTDETGAVWCAVQDKNNDIYLGTGYEGKIYRKRGNSITHIADTDQLVITAMTLDNKGNLYIAALPDAIIWRIDNPKNIGKPVKPTKWVTLPEGTHHVFSMIFDSSGRNLFVGTGPEGDIFAIGPDKKPQKYLETEEEHILSLALDRNGHLLAGTSPSGLLLSISGPGRSVALADFEATEVKAIVVGKDAIFTAVNEFKSPPKVPKKPTTTTTTSTSPKTVSVVGDGEIYRLDAAGRQEKLWSEKKAHVVSLALGADQKLFAGLGSDGKIISIDTERLIRTELDLDERQVMTLIADKDLRFAGTGDAGAAYAIDPARLSEAIFLSPILDTETVSKWGRLRWLSTGKLEVQARTGNTIAPDKSWSDWSTKIKSGTEIPCPPARYLQLRFGFSADKNAVLISAKLAYRPQNGRAIITEFDPDTPFPEPSSSDENLSDRTIASKPDGEGDPERNLRWKVKNPDDDELRYRLWYRKVGETLWRPILKEYQVLETARYTWDTTPVPEGDYQIKLVADDSLSNDPREVTSDTYISVPILVDNHQPRVAGLKVIKDRIEGIAEDSFSNIGAIELSVDNGPWTPVDPKDGILDEPSEPFDTPLPEHLTSGPHAAAIRTFDRRGNMGVGEIHFTTK